MRDASFPLRNRIGVLARRKFNHVDAHAFCEHDVDTAPRRFFTRPVRIEHKHDTLCIPVQQLYLLAGQRRTARRNRIPNADLVQRDNIRIALDEHRFFLLADDLPGLMKPVQYPSLVIYERFRGIDVFRLGVFLFARESSSTLPPNPSTLPMCEKMGNIIRSR